MSRLADYARLLGVIADERGLPTPEVKCFDDDGVIPNSPLPVLIYRGTGGDRSALEGLFAEAQWPVQWHGGVFAFQHYHSTAHEVLGVVGGRAQILLGGPSGDAVDIDGGDVMVIPAGVGHCRLAASADFGVVGGYPTNQPEWDLCRADPAIHGHATARIARVPLPPGDPVAGPDGPLDRYWAGEW